MFKLKSSAWINASIFISEPTSDIDMQFSAELIYKIKEEHLWDHNTFSIWVIRATERKLQMISNTPCILKMKRNKTA